MLLCWITDEDLDTDHIDAVKAFTQAGIDKKVYVLSPEGFTVDHLPPIATSLASTACCYSRLSKV